jgi:hypothetical protein
MKEARGIDGKSSRPGSGLGLIAIPILLLLAEPALAQAPAFTADDLLTVAGLTPGSTVPDAARLYGNDWRKMGADGIEYMAAGSLADAWMTFRPGRFVYVGCGAAPASLPDDVVLRLCNVARRPDWRQSLVQLKEMLRNGRPTAGIQNAVTADRLLSMPAETGKREAGDEEGDSDGDFVELSRTFVGQHYTIVVEVAPMISTRAGTSRAAVMVTWKPN